MRSRFGKCEMTLLFISLLSFASCDTQRLSETAGITISLNPASITLQAGQTRQLVADVTPSDAASRLTWTTAQSNIAAISSSGVVTAVAPGATTVSAVIDGYHADASVNVQSAPPPPPPPPAPVASVSVAPPTAGVQVGQTVQLVATLRDASNNVLTGRSISWLSANPSWATVSAGGVVTGVAPGAVTITATSEGISGSSAITVTTTPPPPPPPPAPVASVTVTPNPASVQVGQTVQLTATMRDASNNVLTGRAVSWSSVATGTATVSAGGVATGIAAGGTTIRATSEGITGTTALTVTAAPPPPPPAPSGLVATAASTSQINLSWADNATTETGFDVEQHAGSGNFTRIAQVGPNVTSWSNTGLTASTTYSYRVRAINGSGASGYSNTATATTQSPPPPPPPPAPSGLVATAASASQVNLSWADNATTETGYEVEQHAGSGTFARIAQLGANVTSWSNTGLNAATTYSYRVRAVNASGASGYSNTATATTQTPPPPPPPPPAGVLFKSDWRYTTGLTADAVQDGPSGNRKWSQWNDFNQLAPPNEILSVVSASGLGFPAGMTNVLRVRQRGGIDAEDVTVTGLPAMAVGDHRYYRLYTRVDENASSGYDHQVQPQAGACAFVWALKRSIGSSTWLFQWQFSNTPSHQWYGLNGSLTKGQVYRVEWHIHRTGTTTFKFDTRIYNAAGTLVYDDDDFQNQDMVNGTLGSIDPNLNMPDFSCQTRLFVGNNGATGFTSGFTYYGGVEVRSDTWPGPYVP